MGDFKVEKSSFKTPPEDSYWLDLVWIERVEGAKGEYYRWHWLISDVEAQKDWKMCRATSQTSLTPTMNNRFGDILGKLLGDVAEGFKGSTEDLVLAKYRVKGFVEHNKKKYEGKKEETIFCNVSKLIEGSSKKGEGVGYAGVSEKVKSKVNEYLSLKGLPLLELKPEDDSGHSRATNPKLESVNAPKREDVCW